MLLDRLTLRNFRSYSEAAFEFAPGINTICGPNAIGKTTLLEAINTLMVGRSFRTTRQAELIKKGEESFYIEALFQKHDVEQLLRMGVEGENKKIYHNTTSLPTFSGLLGILQGVVMTPDDALLVKGGPAVRRRFLDLQLAQIDPLYVHHLSRYYRAMKQRNFLLRRKSDNTIETWEEQMALSGEYIIRQRELAVSDLDEKSRDLHIHLTGEEALLSLKYQATATTNLITHYQKMRRREMELGSTLIGPHRDDLIIAIGKKEVRTFASEGQQRSCVATLKFAEWERLNNLADSTPLMLIDDVGISLDASRIDRLLAHVATLGQVFLTTTNTEGPIGTPLLLDKARLSPLGL